MLKGELDCWVEEVHEALEGLKQVGGVWESKEDVIYEPFPEKNCPDKGFADGFLMSAHEKFCICRGNFGSHGCVYKMKKMVIHE